MRSLFIVSVKLLSIVVIYFAIQIGFSTLLMYGSDFSIESFGFILCLVSPFFILLILSLFMISKTEKIADWFKLNNTEDLKIEISEFALLRTGITLIGLFFFFSFLLNLLMPVEGLLFKLIFMIGSSSFPHEYLQILAKIALYGSSIFIILCSKQIAGFILKSKN